MKTKFRFWSYFALLVTGLSGGLHAQEFSFLTGAMYTPDVKPAGNTYSWQIDYRHGIYKNIEGSLAWINEGHVAGHHRDGNAFEVWYRLPWFENTFRFSFGVGPYYFYDTQPLPGTDDSLNLHSVAPIFSLSASGVIYDRWFWRLVANRINPTTDIKTDTLVLGVGYWLGKEPRLPR